MDVSCVFTKISVGYHGNTGRPGANSNDTVKLPNPENPLFNVNVLHLSLIMHELAYNCSNSPQVVMQILQFGGEIRLI